MEELLEIYGGELPSEIAELYESVLRIYHKKANGQLDLQISCLIAAIAPILVPPPAKPTKKTEKASV